MILHHVGEVRSVSLTEFSARVSVNNSAAMILYIVESDEIVK